MQSSYSTRLILPLLVAAIAVLIVSCDRGNRSGYKTLPISSIEESTILQSIRHLATIQNGHQTKARKSLVKLGHSVDAFLASPDEATMKSMRNNWLQAHQHFLAARFFSFVETDLRSFSVDAWPIQEGFLDHLPRHQHSGIIHDITLPINSETLRAQHGITDTEEVSLGFHALEFLVFSRSIEDYSRVVEKVEEKIDEKVDDKVGDKVVQRRRRVLEIVAEILEEDIETMLSQSRLATLDFSASSKEADPLEISSLVPVLEALYSRISLLFVEANDISEISGHSRFSLSSWQNLKTQVFVLDELTGELTELNRIFQLLDKNMTADYNITLQEALDILSLVDPGDEKKTRLILLVAALGHQLGDFKTALERSIKLQILDQDLWQL